jgi:superfamily II DNA or RNA helicase
VISLYENATHLVVTGDTAELEQIARDLRFRPDGYFFNDRYTRYRITDGAEGWDGWSYPFKVIGGTAGKCLRGRRDEIMSLAKLHGYALNTAKLLSKPFADLALEDVRADLIDGAFRLDDKQRRSIHQWLVHCTGINHITVGGGKTATFAGAARLIKQTYPNARLIYITQSERLVRQAFGDLTGFLQDLNISQFGGGKNNETGKDIVVCTTAMLNRHYARLKSQKWFASFMAILFDEVHHAPSPSAMKVLEAIPAFFRLGATDSIRDDNEGKQGTMVGLFGPIRNKVETHEYMDPTVRDGKIERARLAKPHIYLVDIKEWRNKFENVGFQAVPQTPAFALIDGVWTKATYLGPVYKRDRMGKIIRKRKRTLDEKKQWITVEEPVTEPGLHNLKIGGKSVNIESRWVLLNRLYDRAITRFKERNDLIVQWTKHYSDKLSRTETGDNGGCLVVCTRTLHIYILESLIKRVVDPDLVRILFSKDTSVQRDECFEWFKATPGSVLITPLVKEGVSINEIRAGVIADYVADFDLAKQFIGRFLRPKKTGDNRAEITWFVDNQAPSYRRNCNTLFRQLESVQGFTFYHPCSTPESVTEKLSYEGKPIPSLCDPIDPRRAKESVLREPSLAI